MILHDLVSASLQDRKVERHELLYKNTRPGPATCVHGLLCKLSDREHSGHKGSAAGMQAAYEVLNVLDFTSERARMSIIVRAPDGTIRLHCKGSDSALMARLRPDIDQGTMDQTNTNLHEFSVKACSHQCPFQPFRES